MRDELLEKMRIVQFESIAQAGASSFLLEPQVLW